jgi:hypothetical protein
MGIEVPRRLAVVAWGDSALCRLAHPGMTVLTHDPMTYGAHAARRQLGVIGGAPPQRASTPPTRSFRGEAPARLDAHDNSGDAVAVDLRTAELLRRPLYGQCYDRGDADW